MSDELIPQARVGEVRRPPDRKAAERNASVAVGAGLAAWMISTDPILGSVFVASFGGWYAWQWRKRARWAEHWTRDWTEMRRSLAAGELARAEAVLAGREKISIGGVDRALLAYVRGQIAWARGDLDGAIASFTQAAKGMPVPVRGYEVFHWRVQFHVVDVLLERGRHDEVKPYVERARKAPRDGEWRRFHLGLDAILAHAHDRPDQLGDLDARTREARELKDGMSLAVIAWAHERRGDDAIALYAEAAAIVVPKREIWMKRYPSSWAKLEAKLT
ncbi:MAG TPA: hypothetical protein VL463_04585 [Kofleriaceae bacterium]|nr:hypothetical protein [Kofleriaceae bacterium]